jgi:hypothetical protein
MLLGVGALALVGLTVLVLFLLRREDPRAERLEFSIPLQEETGHLAISADGRMLAFVSPDPVSGANMRNVQRTGAAEVAVLPGAVTG